MTTLLAITALLLVAFFVVGLPIALLIRREQDGRAALAADSILYGFLAVSLAPTLFAWWNIAGIALVAASWLVAIIVLVRRGIVWPPRSAGDPRTVAFWTTVAMVAVVAVAFRMESVNFLPWLGDMGAYINWGNQFARTGELSASWPPLLPAYLGMASAAFSVEHTASAMAAAGLLVPLGVARLLHMLTVNRWVVLLSAMLLSVNVHAIWYSTFPSSEALNAPLVAIWSMTIVGALSARRPFAWAVLSGLALLALGMLRGTGPLLLLPLIILAVCVWLVADWTHLRKAAWALLPANLAAASLAFWYGISEIPRYYVDMQLGELLPGSLKRLLQDDLGLLAPNIQTAILLLAVVASVSIAGWWVQGRAVPNPRVTKVPAILATVLGTVLAMGVIATAAMGTSTWMILLRMNVVLMIGAIVALLLVPRMASAATETVVFILMAGTVITLFFGLHTIRLKIHSDHSFYIYWDRYLVGELLPLMVTLTALALHILLSWGRDRWPQLFGWTRSTPKLAAVSALVWGLITASAGYHLLLMAQDTYMRGAFELQRDLNEAIEDDDDVILWTATSDDRVPGFFFPNTWMAFARPMVTSFGFDVLRLTPRHNFGPDEVADAALLESSAACSDDGSLTVFELRNGGPGLSERISNGPFDVTLLSTERGTLSLLQQPPLNGWQRLEFVVDVWKVTANEPLSPSLCQRSF